MPRMRRPRECDSNAARESDSHARLVRRASVPWGSSARGNMREKTRRAFASCARKVTDDAYFRLCVFAKLQRSVGAPSRGLTSSRTPSFA